MSRAYRADDAEDGAYAEWLDLLESRVEPGARILDLGCGCGIPVARRLAGRYEVTGIDISPVQVARARELVPGATFLCADMTGLQLPDERFGAIVCLYALIHLPLGSSRSCYGISGAGFDPAASSWPRSGMGPGPESRGTGLAWKAAICGGATPTPRPIGTGSLTRA